MLSGIARFVEGMGAGFTITALMAFLSSIYPNERGKVFSGRTCGAGTGICLGLICGAAVYNLLGYFGVFLACSVLSLLTILALVAFKK